MILTREILDRWAAQTAPGIIVLKLEEGDNMPVSDRALHRIVEGPAIVELVRYRDGGWDAHALQHETPESIAITASLGPRRPHPPIPLPSRTRLKDWT